MRHFFRRTAAVDSTSHDRGAGGRGSDVVLAALARRRREERRTLVINTVAAALAAVALGFAAIAAWRSWIVNPNESGAPRVAMTAPEATTGVSPRPDSLVPAVGAPVEGSAPPPATAVARPPAAETPAAMTPDHFARALQYQRAGDLDRAINEYRLLLAQNERPEVHNNLGLLYQERGEAAEALASFQRAVDLEPRYAKAHNNLGVAHMRAGRLDAAAAEFRAALVTDSRNLESMVNLALVDQARGATADARDRLRRALLIDPRHAGAHYNLAVVADESGDAATAVTHYRAFLLYGSLVHPDLAARVRTRLDTLDPD